MTRRRLNKFRIVKWVRVGVSLLLLAAFLVAGSSLFPPAAFLARFEFVAGWYGTALISSLVLLMIWAVTLLWGRFYCSWCCPLGALQDVFAWLGRRLPFKTFRYRYRKERFPLWTLVISVLFFALIGGWVVPLGWLEPYSLFMRGTASAGQPALIALSDFIYEHTSWHIVPREMKPAASPVLVVVTLLLLAGILLSAFWRGRLFCNTFCPVGGVLRLAARLARYPLTIDPERCVKCGRCVRACKAGCIDLKTQSIDSGRCVACFNCAAVCGADAVHFLRRERPLPGRTPEGAEVPKIDAGRRGVIALGVLGGAGAFASGVAVRRFNRVSGAPVMPPGALDRERFFSRCTGCQLCVANCTGKTLVPALDEYGLAGVGMPVLSFHAGRCEFNCHNCSKVCPTGALTNIGGRAKRRLRIGVVSYDPSRCVVPLNGTSCGACAEHCPVGALQMEPWKDGLTIPHVITELCIGCGSCEYICPVVGEKAVRVSGVAVQEAAADPAEVLKKRRESSAGEAVGDFPF